jgi:hypothetical protein
MFFTVNYSFSQGKFNEERLKTSKKLIALIEKKEYREIKKQSRPKRF